MNLETKEITLRDDQVIYFNLPNPPKRQNYRSRKQEEETYVPSVNSVLASKVLKIENSAMLNKILFTYIIQLKIKNTKKYSAPSKLLGYIPLNTFTAID